MARYAIVATTAAAGTDATGNPVTIPAGTVVDIAVWDGVTPWSPGTGFEAVADPSAAAVVGGSYSGGAFSAPA